MVEQKRFDKNAAWMAKELQKFHQLQKEYLFLVNNDIKSVEGLITYEVLKGMDVERISNRQKEIYKESGARKRACKTMADVREFQIWHMQAQEELDDLKAEKREIKDNLKLVEEKVSNTVQVPEYPYGDERAETVMDVVENDLDAVGDMEVSVEVKANAEEYIDDKNLSEAESTDVEENMDKSVNYESFMSMSPEDMAGILGFDRIVGIDEVHSKVSSFFRDVKSYVDGNEIMDVAKLVYKGMRANFIKQRAEEIVEAINSMGLSYPCLTDKEKAELFRFLPDDNNYNLELHMAVLKACGLKLEFDEVYEDYQRIYDKTMEMQDEKMNERGESVRGRAR